jgi:hypothetical protein
MEGFGWKGLNEKRGRFQSSTTLAAGDTGLQYVTAEL